jgi:hypothetical protein
VDTVAVGQTTNAHVSVTGLQMIAVSVYAHTEFRTPPHHKVI